MTGFTFFVTLFIPSCIGISILLDGRLTHEGTVAHASEWNTVFPGYEGHGPGPFPVPEDARDISYKLNPARFQVQGVASQDAVLRWVEEAGMMPVDHAGRTPARFMMYFSEEAFPRQQSYRYFASEPAPNGAQIRSVYVEETEQFFYERNAW